MTDNTQHEDCDDVYEDDDQVASIPVNAMNICVDVKDVDTLCVILRTVAETLRAANNNVIPHDTYMYLKSLLTETPKESPQYVPGIMKSITPKRTIVQLTQDQKIEIFKQFLYDYTIMDRSKRTRTSELMNLYNTVTKSNEFARSFTQLVVAYITKYKSPLVRKTVTQGSFVIGLYIYKNSEEVVIPCEPARSPAINLNLGPKPSIITAMNMQN